MAQPIGGKTTNVNELDNSPIKPVTVSKSGNKTGLDVNIIAGDITEPSNLEGGGDVTVGTSEVEITFTGTTQSILISASDSNTGIIFIGKTGVLSDGTNHFAKLSAGDDLVLDYDDSSNALFAISDTAAQTLSKGALL